MAGRFGNYDTSTAALSIGASVELDESGFLVSSSNHYYTGQLDDVRIFFWGDNSDQLGYDDAPGGTNNNPGDLNADGQDWGALDSRGRKTTGIAQKLSALAVSAGVGSIPATDLDFDGDTDASRRVGLHRRTGGERTSSAGCRSATGTAGSSAISTTMGSSIWLTAFLIHDQLAPLGGLHFSRLGAVPEPGSGILMLIGMTLFGGLRRGRRG